MKLKDKPFSLVLEEDGTIVETEEYFQALSRDTVFMVLQKGQKWKPPSSEQVPASWGGGGCGELGGGPQASLSGLVLQRKKRAQQALSQKAAKKIDVARVTFDLYKLNPQDFIGCLNVKATLYDTYSLSYDLHCYKAKRIVK